MILINLYYIKLIACLLKLDYMRADNKKIKLNIFHSLLHRDPLISIKYKNIFSASLDKNVFIFVLIIAYYLKQENSLNTNLFKEEINELEYFPFLLNSFSHEETGNLNIISKIFMARSG